MRRKDTELTRLITAWSIPVRYWCSLLGLLLISEPLLDKGENYDLTFLRLNAKGTRRMHPLAGVVLTAVLIQQPYPHCSSPMRTRSLRMWRADIKHLLMPK